MRPILVTGAAQGLGAEICLQLAQQGHDLVVHYRKSDPTAVIEACQAFGVEVAALKGDFSTLDQLNDFIRRYKEAFTETQGIVHNVGNYLIARASATPAEAWGALYQTNACAPAVVTHALLPALRAAQGCVVHVGTSGLLGALVESAAYGMSKAALLFYTRSLAKELAAERVRVNMVSPGYLETAVDLAAAPKLPMGRPVTLKEVAHAVAFFFAPASRSITGQNLEVAGGLGL